MYLIQTNNFSLSFSFIGLHKESSSIPCIVDIHISNKRFSGKRQMDITYIELLKFIRSLKSLYNDLSGQAVLNEHFEFRSFVRFVCTNTGHIIINGELNEMLNHWTFEATVDQTEIKGFVTSLYNDFIG